MAEIEYLMRYVLSALAIAVIVNCVWSLIRLKPDKKVYALLVNMANEEKYSITCYETSIGRSRSNDITFTNSTVSRSHAVLALRKDGFYIFDTESKAGVFVNGEQITKGTKLSDGDTIAFGTAFMKFYIGSEADGDISHEDEVPMPRLVNIVDGSEFVLDGDYITIGREAGSNIELPARYVSRRQTELYKSNNKWIITDYGRVTKTTLNGVAIQGSTFLKDGDVIKIGDYAFLFEE